MNKKEKQFVETVWEYYKKHGRHTLPWRKTKNPYRILVSEVMLQQTQVERVVPKYKSFLQKWGTIGELAEAPLGDVLTEWQGLGYNRRAKMLHNCALAIMHDSKSTFPKTPEELEKLPGVGPYTAGAIMAFAYNNPVPVIETNIRTVFLHHFFEDKTDVTDSDLLRYIIVTLDTENPRAWYWALMDYGAYLKKEHGSQNSRSKHYTKQSSFNGSDRQIRGALLREFTNDNRPYTRLQLHRKLRQFEDVRIDAQLVKLVQEKMLSKNKTKYQLPN